MSNNVMKNAGFELPSKAPHPIGCEFFLRKLFNFENNLWGVIKKI